MPSQPSDPQNPRLLALADLHLSFPLNAAELDKLTPHPHDTLILAGDLGEKPEQLHHAFRVTSSLFHAVHWVPGNHELYTLPSSATNSDPTSPPPRGVAKYEECVSIAREYGVCTPEDEWPIFTAGDGTQVLIALLFTLYDYTFAPEPHNKNMESALAWAREIGTEATDEALLHSDPFVSKAAWGAARLRISRRKLIEARATHPHLPLVIVNHWPLSKEHIFIPLAPRFEIWCGSTQTEGWAEEFGASVVVSGHLHVRRTDWQGQTRFEEVSLGYPKQWEDARNAGKSMGDMMRTIWPWDGERKEGTRWRKFG